MNDDTLVVEARSLSKSYAQGDAVLDVLVDVNLPVQRGERIVVLGRSGSGKSTLLHLLAGLTDPTQGEVWVQGECLNRLSADGRAAVRRRAMGFVYQFHHLLPEFNALENVAMPLRLAGVRSDDAKSRAEAALHSVALDNRLSHQPAELSGGERQRVAIARALVSQPKLILADEPTGNLDRDNADEVFALMCDLTRETGAAYVVATHDPLLARDATRVVRLDHGRIIDN